MNKKLTKEEEIEFELSYLKKIGYMKDISEDLIRKAALGTDSRPLELVIDLNLKERDSRDEDIRR
jgi:hypothetical protein